MGAPGGVGRYERLLLRALQDIESDGVFQTKTLWRKSHPQYLDQASDTKPSDSLTSFVARVAVTYARWRPDIVIYSHINLSRLAPVLAPLSPGTQCVVCLHGIEAWVELKGPRMTALKHAARVVATTSYMQDYVRRVHGIQSDRVVRIPLSLEPRWFGIEPGSAQDEGVVLTVSRLDSASRHKGVDKMIRALPVICQTAPTLRYVIVGTGDDVAFLRGLASENGAERFICWAGALTDDELCSAYEQCDVFALPSDNDGFGLVFLEAMAHTKPVVAWDARGISDVVVDGITGVLANTEDALAATIADLLNDPVRRVQMGREGYRRLHDQFSYERYVESWRKLLIELARHSSGATAP
jgi:phosphatidylinositol alpha-1,6-mannosyltransferase